MATTAVLLAKQATIFIFSDDFSCYVSKVVCFKWNRLVVTMMERNTLFHFKCHLADSTE